MKGQKFEPGAHANLCAWHLQPLEKRPDKKEKTRIKLRDPDLTDVDIDFMNYKAGQGFGAAGVALLEQRPISLFRDNSSLLRDNSRSNVAQGSLVPRVGPDQP